MAEASGLQSERAPLGTGLCSVALRPGEVRGDMGINDEPTTGEVTPEEGTRPDATRRQFCASACRALSVAALGALLPGCGGGGDSPTSPGGAASTLPTANATVTGGAATLTIDGSSPLASTGSMALVQSSSGMFLVARTAQTTFVAVSAMCTHENCTINGFSGSNYQCPCHGSQFSTTGAVLRGPATRALRQYTTALNGNMLSITL